MLPLSPTFVIRDKRMRGWILCMILCLMVPMVAVAQEEETGMTPLPTKLGQKLNTQTAELMEGMSANEALQFREIRLAFSTLFAVEDVQGMLDRAVDSCSKTSPDLAEEIKGHFVGWKDSVEPSLKEGHERLDDMIGRQSFAKPLIMRSYLSLLRRVMEEQKKMTPEIPITEPAACKRLIHTMDSTQSVVNESITESLKLDVPLRYSE